MRKQIDTSINRKVIVEKATKEILLESHLANLIDSSYKEYDNEIPFHTFYVKGNMLVFYVNENMIFLRADTFWDICKKLFKTTLLSHPKCTEIIHKVMGQYIPNIKKYDFGLVYDARMKSLKDNIKTRLAWEEKKRREYAEPDVLLF